MNNFAIIRCLLIAIYAVSSFSVLAQDVHKKGAYVEVHVSDTTLRKSKLEVRLIEDYIFADIGSIDTLLTADQHGIFRFSAPHLKHIVKVEFILGKCGFLANYLEPADSLKITYTGNCNDNSKLKDLIFSGKGAEKFRYMNIIKFLRSETSPQISGKFNQNLLEQRLVERKMLYDQRKKILNTYKKNLSKEAFGVLIADIYGRSFSSFFSDLHHNYSSNIYRKVLTGFYDSLGDLSLPISPSSLVQSDHYLKFLIEKSRAVGRVKVNNPGERFDQVYREILKVSPPILREKSLVTYFANPLNTLDSENSNETYQDALQYISTPKYFQYVLELQNVRRKGENAYNFMLPDDKGNMVSLKDFSGKVVVLDCWFTGCSSCSNLSKMIEKEVLPHFKNNNEVSFVSVSVDKDQARWKESLKSGLYTNQKSINLYTEGLGLKHPFMENYHFQGFPQLLLIDRKGKIFSATMSRTASGINALIHKALESK